MNDELTFNNKLMILNNFIYDVIIYVSNDQNKIYKIFMH